MTKTRITQRTTNNPTNLPPRGVVRFDGNIQAASRGTAVSQLQPIRFTPGGEYLEQMNAIADLGEGIFNATAKIAVASQRAKEAEKDAYLDDIRADDIVQTDRIYNENRLAGNDPQVLATKLEEYRNGKMANMPQDIQPFYQREFDIRAASLGIRSQDEFYRQAQENARVSKKANLEIIKDDIFKNPMPITEIDQELYQSKLTSYKALQQSRIDNGDITSEEALLEEKDFRKDIITQAYKAHLDSQLNSDARAQEILKLHKAKTLPTGLDESDRDDIVARLNAYDSTINAIEIKANAAKKAEQEAINAKLGADLEVNVNRDKATEEDVLEAERKGIITPAKRVALIGKLDQNLRDGVKKSMDIQKVANAFIGKAYLDPKTSSDDFKAVNYFYETETKPQLKNIVDPEERAAALTYFVNGTGVVPDDLRGEIRGVFRGGDVDSKVFYADLVGRIQETTPRALDDFDDKDIAQAVMIDEMVKAGTPNERAVELVEQQTTGINSGRLEVLKTELEAKNRDIGTKQEQNVKILSIIRDNFEAPGANLSWFDFDAALPNEPQLGVEPEAIAEYKRLYKTWYYNTNGNDELAKRQALKSMERNWGTTSINGVDNQLTKYPIEKQYPDMPYKEIKKDLINDLKGLGYTDIDPKQVYIQDDALTARQAGKGATYQVMMPDETGKLVSVKKGNNILRWRPSVQSWFIRNLKKTEEKALAEQDRAKRLKGLPQLEEELQPYTFNPLFK